jgi:hypothetical protein
VFGLDTKSLLIGGALGMFIVPRIVAFATSKMGGGAK